MIDLSIFPFLIITLLPANAPADAAQYHLQIGYCCADYGSKPKYKFTNCIKSARMYAGVMHYQAQHYIAAETANEPIAINAAIEHLLTEAQRICGMPS